MALRKITFDGATVSSKDDADINYHLFDLVPAGIIKGLGSEVSVSAGNNTIIFGSGYIQIYGRRIYMEANTQIGVTLDSSKNGYIVVEVNLATNTLELKRLEQTYGWPSLTQNNLSTTNGRYQFPIAKYTKTATSLSLDSAFTQSRPKIDTLSNMVNEKSAAIRTELLNRFRRVTVQPIDPWGTVKKYNISDFPYPLEECLIHVRLGWFATFVFSGGFAKGSSMSSLRYRYAGSDYYLTIEYTGSQIYLYSNNTSHNVGLVEVFR